MFNLFNRLNSKREFGYRPRYYDPDKERREARKKELRIVLRDLPIDLNIVLMKCVPPLEEAMGFAHRPHSDWRSY